jgi:hypothetical protein
VIPAHPLALDSASRKFDERRQRALTRYYVEAGSGGLAVGVHTTQFAIRDVGFYEPVLSLAMQTARETAKKPARHDRRTRRAKPRRPSKKRRLRVGTRLSRRASCRSPR